MNIFSHVSPGQIDGDHGITFHLRPNTALLKKCLNFSLKINNQSMNLSLNSFERERERDDGLLVTY